MLVIDLYYLHHLNFPTCFETICLLSFNVEHMRFGSLSFLDV